MSQFSISLLGSFEANLDGQPLSNFRTRSVQALLIYLVCAAERPHRPGSGQASPREQLMDLLWPGMPLQSAQANLRQTIYRLRQMIPELNSKEGDTAVPFLITNRQTIQINPDADYIADVHAFDALIDQDPEQAIALYQGDFLTDFFLPDSDTFEEWANNQREAYRRQALDAMETITAVHLQDGRYEAAIQLALRQLEIDNLREISHRQLMEANARNGHRQVALSHFNTFTQLLADELAIEPESETVALIERIRAGEIATESSEAPESAETDADSALPDHNLPRSLTSFIGRQREIEAIAELLAQNQLVMLTGAGGIGKTNLCLQVGRAQLASFPDGVWLIELAPITDPTLIPQTVTRVLGVQDVHGRANAPETLGRETAVVQTILQNLIEHLQDKACLLILDNCEHLIDEAAQFVETVLQSCPHVKILASSREALGVPGERPFRVPPLSIPQNGQSADYNNWVQFDALRLFVERAKTILPQFEVTADNYAAILQICKRLDGIPLALELAAARIPVLDVEQIAIRLDDRFRLLTGGSRTALPRQQTLRALVDWSWDLLTDEERILMKRLSVFAGEMSLEAIEFVCADEQLDVYDLLDLLAELVNKSLVLTQHDEKQETRYRLLETIRQYAQERLVASGHVEKFRNRLLQYYLQLAEQAEPELIRTEQVSWLQRLEKELDNLRTTLNWALETNAEAGLHLVTDLWRFWYRGYLREGGVWLEQFVEKAENSAVELQAKALFMLSSFHLNQNNVELAHQLAEESLKLYVELGDELGVLKCKMAMTVFLDPQTQQEHLLEGLAAFREIGDKMGVADALTWLAHGEMSVNHFDQGITYLQESLTLYRELGHIDGVGGVLSKMGQAYIWQENYEAARPVLEESLEVQLLLGWEGSSWHMQNFGALYFRTGEYEKARHYYQKGIYISEKTGDRRIGHWSRVYLGHLAIFEGNLLEARQILVETLHYFVKGHDDIGIVFAIEGLAHVAVAEGNMETAVILYTWADRSREVIKDLRPPVEQADVDQDLAQALETLGEAAYQNQQEQGERISLEEVIALALENA